jgi:hypothetical protein
MPLVAMLELDRRSTPDGSPRPASPLLGWWWAAWLGQQFIPQIAIWAAAMPSLVRLFQQVDENTTRIDFTTVTRAIAPWVALAGVLQLIAAVLACFVVRQIDAAQSDMVDAAMAPPPRPDAAPFVGSADPE